MLLPSGALTGYAEEVIDQKKAMRAIWEILKNSGLVGYIYGFNPYYCPRRCSSEEDRRNTSNKICL
ncbi:MAG: hypothetical protein ABR985_19085 [Methanotrichaceae archaeon]